MSLDLARLVGRSPNIVAAVGVTERDLARFAAVALAMTTSCSVLRFFDGSEPPPPSAEAAVVGRQAAKSRNPCLTAALESVEIDPRQPRNYRLAKARFDEGVALQSQGLHAEALERFQKAVGEDPTFGLAHLEAALSHLYTDNAHEALLKHLSAAIVLMPRNPRAQLQFAQLQKELGAPKLAEQHFGCAVELNPTLAPAHESLARLLLNEGRVAEAERRARVAVRLAPMKTTYRVLLADILTRRQQWTEAGAEVELAAQQVGRSAALYRRAAQLFAKGGAYTDADRLRAVADRIDPPPERRKLRPLLRRR